MNSPIDTKDTLSGFFYALTAYLMWGFLPLFMKAVAHIPPVEIIAHRVIWSIPIAAAVLLCQGRSHDLIRALKNPAMLAMAAVTAALVSINWLIYVWAIGTGLVPTLPEIAQVHSQLRAHLVQRFGPEGALMRLLYGGSVKPSNADDIFALPDVDGALVGGASLKAVDFGAIISALSAA
jgi:uncharacterized membrane protein